VQAGIEAIGSPQARDPLTMFFVALFLAFGKRRSELAQLPDDARGRRSVLGAYSVPLLDLLLALSATTALLCYALYAVTIQTEETFLLTVLPVTFGILRYLMLVLVHERGEDPDELVTRDGPLVVAILVWAALSIAVLYLDWRLVPGPPRMGH
jgi:4-hydroxybenzoate polyprenyltransferase